MSFELKFQMLPGEHWWGGLAHCGHMMPFNQTNASEIDPTAGADLDSGASAFLSSKGRLLWSETAFAFKCDAGEIYCSGSMPIMLQEGHNTLRGAYLALSKHIFPPAGQLPDERFFSRPQYNTWIELGTNQTAEAILAYAQSIVDQELPPGILMIDEGWAEEYGSFEFNRRKIPNPKQLIDSLHTLGFAVMLWVTPTVNAAGPQFKRLREQGMLLRNRAGEVAIREWWNGYSAVMDLTDQRTQEWLSAELSKLMAEFGVDGFKFDGGDRYFYRDDDLMRNQTSAREQTRVYNLFGAKYSFNEFRAAWNCGGQPIVARLQDKLHSWGNDGLSALIPNTIVQGLLGYSYCCPDMVGGGDISSFDAGQSVDQELFVRWAQANACMGMMQISVSPWRVLNRKNVEHVVQAMNLHLELSEEVRELSEHARVTGEPIVRALDYVFPGQGFEAVTDCFMLGDDLLVCPVLQKGMKKRDVRLPSGNWMSWHGELLKGGRNICFDVTLEDIPRFRKVAE